MEARRAPAGTPNRTQAAQAWARQHLFQFAACAPDAGLLGRWTSVTPGQNPNQAPPVTSPTCQ